MEEEKRIRSKSSGGEEEDESDVIIPSENESSGGEEEEEGNVITPSQGQGSDGEEEEEGNVIVSSESESSGGEEEEESIVITPARAKRLRRQRTSALPIHPGNVVFLERQPFSLLHTVLVPVQVLTFDPESKGILAKGEVVAPAGGLEAGDGALIHATDLIRWNGFRMPAMEYRWWEGEAHECRATRRARREKKIAQQDTTSSKRQKV